MAAKPIPAHQLTQKQHEELFNPLGGERNYPPISVLDWVAELIRLFGYGAAIGLIRVVTYRGLVLNLRSPRPPRLSNGPNLRSTCLPSAIASFSALDSSRQASSSLRTRPTSLSCVLSAIRLQSAMPTPSTFLRWHFNLKAQSQPDSTFNKLEHDSCYNTDEHIHSDQFSSVQNAPDGPGVGRY